MTTLTKTKVDFFQVDAQCNCGSAMKFVSQVERRYGLYVMTTKFLHRCPACGAEADLNRVFPYIEPGPAGG